MGPSPITVEEYVTAAPVGVTVPEVVDVDEKAFDNATRTVYTDEPIKPVRVAVVAADGTPIDRVGVLPRYAVTTKPANASGLEVSLQVTVAWLFPAVTDAITGAAKITCAACSWVWTWLEDRTVE
jgi:hypothetical protein